MPLLTQNVTAKLHFFDVNIWHNSVVEVAFPASRQCKITLFLAKIYIVYPVTQKVCCCLQKQKYGFLQRRAQGKLYVLFTISKQYITLGV